MGSQVVRAGLLDEVIFRQRFREGAGKEGIPGRRSSGYVKGPETSLVGSRTARRPM